MTNAKKSRYSPFNDACQRILFQYPEAIGVAYKVLNCGCALICGATAGGDPIGELQYISGQPVKGAKQAPICLKCRKGDGLDRVVWEGIYWPGSQSEWPEKDFRVSIGRKIFGIGYMEAD